MLDNDSLDAKRDAMTATEIAVKQLHDINVKSLPVFLQKELEDIIEWIKKLSKEDVDYESSLLCIPSFVQYMNGIAKSWQDVPCEHKSSIWTLFSESKLQKFIERTRDLCISPDGTISLKVNQSQRQRLEDVWSNIEMEVDRENEKKERKARKDKFAMTGLFGTTLGIGDPLVVKKP